MTAAQIIEERLAELQGASLARGSGNTPDTACAMNWLERIVGTPWEQVTDSGTQANVSPVIRAFLVRLNDRLDDERRQQLVPYLPRCVNTKDGRDDERRQLAVEWAVKHALPQWLELAGMTERAVELRNVDSSEWTPELRKLLRTVSDECWQARSDARGRLRDKVTAAVKKELKKKPVAAAVADADAVAAAVAVAAADADAAAVAAAAAAADAVAAAAAAAGPGRWNRVYDAVYKAVREKLAPVIEERVGPLTDQMLPGALDLLDRMIELKPAEAAP